MEDSTLSFFVKYKGATHEISVPKHTTLKELGVHLQNLLDITPKTQKLIFSKHTMNDRALYLDGFEDNSSETLTEAGINEGDKLLLVGSTQQELDSIHHKRSYPVLGFEEEEERARRRARPDDSKIARSTKTEYFGGMEVLRGPQFIVPPPSDALELLKDIAYDPGIVAIMRKHRWNVGILAEMPPEGLVGVDKVCTLGYNVNNGEKIYLRLRTDDLKGFRKYSVIKQTMLHELSHNNHMDHSDKFWQLFRELEKEAVELDWTKSKGYVLGDNTPVSTYNSGIEKYENQIFENKKSETQKVEIETETQTIKPQFEKEKSTTQKSQTKAENIPTSATRDTNSHPTQSNSIATVDTVTWNCHVCTYENTSRTVCEICQTPKMDSSSQTQKFPDPQLSLHQDGKIISTWNCSVCTFENSTTRTVCEVCGTGNNSITKSSPSQPSAPSPPPPPPLALPNTTWNCTVCTFENPGTRTVCEICATGKKANNDESKTSTTNNLGDIPTTLTNIEPENNIPASEPTDFDTNQDILFGDTSLVNIHNSTSHVGQEIDKDIDIFINSTPKQEATLTLSTLNKILGNILKNPSEEKFRKIPVFNKVFYDKVGRHSKACDVLLKVGFEQDKNHGYYIFKRNDFGLIWLAKSSIESRLNQIAS